MTRPIYEPSLQRTDARLGYTTNQLLRRPAPIGAGRFVCLIYSSAEPVQTGDDAAGFFLVIPEDLGSTSLQAVAAGVYTPGTDVVVQVRNVTQATDMLTTPITIDSGDNTSYTSGTPPVIDPAAAAVDTGDIIVCDVDDDGGAEGLDLILAFS